MRSSHSPTIRSRYDYYYSSMSPASTATNFYDNHNQSLFGDPVPPSTDFLETLDNHLYGSFRRGSVLSHDHGNNDSNFIDDFMAAQSNAHRLHMTSGTKDRSAPPPSDLPFRDELMRDTKRRCSSSFPDEFRANLDAFGSESEILIPTAPKRLFSEEPVNYRNLISMQSSDSQNGNESDWIRPSSNNLRDFPRPASRNVMQIDHSNGMVGVLQESTGSSSDETKPVSCGNVRQIQVLPFEERQAKSPAKRATRPNTNESSSEDVTGCGSPTKRDPSTAIVTDTIKTGSEFRLVQPRLHKKTSFTIINELEPNQSRPESPTGGRASPFRGKGFRSGSSRRLSRPVSCPDSPRNSMAPETPSSQDDTQIHSKPSVHFNVIPPIPRKRTAIQVIETTADGNERRGSAADINYRDRDMESFELLSNRRSRSGSFSRRDSRAVKPLPAPRMNVPRSVSPIVGTPNKDCDSPPSSDENRSRNSTNDSPTKIPVRRSSSVNINGSSSRTGSRINSRTNSREASPSKPSTLKSPTKIPQKINAKSKVAKTPSGSTKSIPSAVNKEGPSTRKEPAINREKSSVKKAPASAVKKEPSTLKRQPSNINLKRQNSQQKLKRENSTVRGGGGARSPAKGTTTLAKNQSDSSLSKRVDKKNALKQTRRTSSESDGLNEMDTANLSDKLIELTKPNGVSMTTAAVASQPVQITTAVTNHLSKKNSSGQIVNNDNSDRSIG